MDLIILLLIDSEGNFNIIKMYVHRYLRLTPLVLAAMIYIMTLEQQMGTGPIWKYHVTLRRSICERQWWKTLLYMQNYDEPFNSVKKIDILSTFEENLE